MLNMLLREYPQARAFHCNMKQYDKTIQYIVKQLKNREPDEPDEK